MKSSATIAATATFASLLPATLPAQENQGPHVLLVLTNHSQMGEKATGLYLSEAAEPFYALNEAGFRVSLISPDGGRVPIDPSSFNLDTPENLMFWKFFGNENENSPVIPGTFPAAGVKAETFAGIFFAGGHGTMWDFADSKPLQKLTAALYEAEKPVAAVCHGPAALVKVTLSDGTPLVKGKEVAAFTNSEEKAAGATDLVPFSLQDSLEKAGAKVKTAPDFTENAVRDGHLITGQNPASAAKTARLFLEALGADSKK